MPNFGKIAYEAYANHTNWKSIVSGASFPTWDDLDQIIKDAWFSSANAVLEYNGEDDNERDFDQDQCPSEQAVS